MDAAVTPRSSSLTIFFVARYMSSSAVPDSVELQGNSTELKFLTKNSWNPTLSTSSKGCSDRQNHKAISLFSSSLEHAGLLPITSFPYADKYFVMTMTFTLTSSQCSNLCASTRWVVKLFVDVCRE